MIEKFRLSAPSRRLFKYFKPYWYWLVFGVLCVLLTNLVKLTGPWILGHAIDDLLSGVTRAKLLQQGGLLVLIALAQGLFFFWQRRIFTIVSRKIESDLRKDYYAHLQKLPSLDKNHSFRTGDLMARGTNDLTAVRMIGDTALMSIMDVIFVIALVVPMMGAINWRLTILSLFTLPLVIVATKFLSKRIHERAVEVQEQYGAVSSRAQDSLAGVRVVRAYAQEQSEVESFTRVNGEFVKSNLGLIRLTMLMTPILQFLMGFGFIAVFWYGGSLILGGEITIGQYVQFKIYLGFLIVPVVMFGWMISVFQKGIASMGRIHNVLETEPAIDDAEQNASVRNIVGDIEFRNLTFSYKGASQPTLKNLNLHIKAGQTVAFVGAVGSGKSTLVNLVPRLLDAAPGQVLIDGHPIDEIPLKVLRTSVGYVPQETFLFSESIADNVSFGAENASSEQIRRAATEAGVADDIEGFPRKYETLVGERGVMLSGGQKQRTAIARALVTAPQILILDDALSAVDTYTERTVLSHLRRGNHGRTCLIVSHRVSTVRNADLIVVLEGNQIAERGTHSELITRGGLYAALHDKQLLEEELETT